MAKQPKKHDKQAHQSKKVETDQKIHEPELDNGESEKDAGQDLILARDMIPTTLPIIPITGHPMFPRITVPVVVDNPVLSKMLIGNAEQDRRHVGVLLRRDVKGNENKDVPDPKDLYSVGVVCEVAQLAQAAEGVVHVLVNTLERFRIESFVQREPFLVAEINILRETEMAENQELKAYSISLIKAVKELVELNPLHKEELGLFMQHTNLAEPGRLADIAAALTTSKSEEMQAVLETVSIRERLQKTLGLVRKEINVSRIQAKISKQIDEKVSRQQREFFLKEQLKAIKKELGIEKEGKETEIDRFEKRIEALDLSEEARERAKEELDKITIIEPMSPEFSVSRNYLDWLTSLPWGVFTEDSYDLDGASKQLNADHYGLEDVKERILEFLSVGIMKGNISGSILCFVGPPGVGKTSIGHSIAEALGRNFFRFSVGGMRDEAEIKGHRRTYIGAMPGKFIQTIKNCKSANPVIMLDEIDKIGASYQGDPASALLEVLDPEQNSDFLDHYLDVRFDLSNVLFICTANQLDTIPRPLLDRMEIIKLAGYIQQEKLQIARRYLVPKQLKENGLKRSQISLTSPTIRAIIEGYAREPGVRTLEKHIGKIMRKCAKRFVEGEKDKISVKPTEVRELLGKKLFMDEPAERPAVGVVTGLAWTRLGGDTLSIEATSIKIGKADFKQTGQLGNVMVESSEIAYTFVRSLIAKENGNGTFFDNNRVHLHVPAGATPKDGPSAGITMATALYALATGKRLKKRIAMTGELTLTGRVMAIGGLKEKTIAARRAKIRTLIFPDDNRRDFEDLPAHIRKGITAHFVKRFEDVITICF